MVRAPVASGLQSFAAANLADGDPGDALVCGGDDRAKELSLELAGRLAGRAVDCRPARELAFPRRDDRRHPEREQALQGARGHQLDGIALSRELRIIPVTGLPEIEDGEDLAELISAKVELEDGDVVVLAQKSCRRPKAESCSSPASSPQTGAIEIAGDARPSSHRGHPREAARVVRVRPPLVIAETTHGFICASAGVDASNAPAPDMLVLLPVDPDASAAQLRERFRELTGKTSAC